MNSESPRSIQAFQAPIAYVSQTLLRCTRWDIALQLYLQRVGLGRPASVNSLSYKHAARQNPCVSLTLQGKRFSLKALDTYGAFYTSCVECREVLVPACTLMTLAAFAGTFVGSEMAGGSAYIPPYKRTDRGAHKAAIPGKHSNSNIHVIPQVRACHSRSCLTLPTCLRALSSKRQGMPEVLLL